MGEPKNLLGDVMKALDLMEETSDRSGKLRVALWAAGPEHRVAWDSIGVALGAAQDRTRTARLLIVERVAEAERELASLRELLARSR